MKHTIKQIVHYRLSEYTGEEEFALFASDLSGYGMGHVKVCETEVTFETPDDFNPVAAQVESLKQAESKLYEDFNKKTAAIREQISKLQALTYTQEA